MSSLFRKPKAASLPTSEKSLSESEKSSLSQSEKSPLISHIIATNNDIKHENNQKYRISFSQLRPFLNIAIPYFRHNRSGIL